LPDAFDVAVLVRSAGEPGLQGLRCGLSLSLGDRVPRVYLVGAGLELLGATAGSEAEAVLRSLVDEVGAGVVAESDGGGPAVPGVGRRRRAAILREVAGARFQQVF